MAGLDDTEQESESVSKHLGKMRERMTEARADEDETSEVSVETPEDDDEDEEAEVAAPSRKERRAGRMTSRERAAAAEAEARVLRELVQQRQPERQAPQAPAVDTADIDKKIHATYAELERLENEYVAAQQSKTLTPAREQAMRARAQELEIEKLELAAERREMRTAPARRKKEFYDGLAREFSDVYGNPAAARYAYGRGQQLIAMGRADDKALHDEVMAETRQVVLGIKPKPDAIDRQRATGMSAGPRSIAPTTRSTISMPKGSHYYKMATALYPDLDPGAACQKWAQGPGKRLLASKG